MGKLIFFIVGMIAGGLVTLVILCCLQINRINEYESLIRKLKEQKTP